MFLPVIMPKKKKGEGKGKKKGGKGAEEKPKEEKKDTGPPPPTERELALKNEWGKYINSTRCALFIHITIAASG